MGPFNTYFLYLFPDCISIRLNSMIIPIERRKLFQLISLNYQYKILYHVFITNHVVQALPGSRFKNMFCFDFYCFSSYILSWRAKMNKRKIESVTWYKTNVILNSATLHSEWTLISRASIFFRDSSQIVLFSHHPLHINSRFVSFHNRIKAQKLQY